MFSKFKTGHSQDLAQQSKTAGHARPLLKQTGRAPVAPPVYRPQPKPGILQQKIATNSPATTPQTAQIFHPTRRTVTPSASQARPRPLATQPGPAIPQRPSQSQATQARPLSRPSTLPQTQKVMQAKLHVNQNILQRQAEQPRRAALPARPSPTANFSRKTVLQPMRSVVVQAKAMKFYPNLHPGAAIPVERSNIFMLNNFADQYRLQRVDSHGVNVPNQKYNFVRTREGATLLHNRYRHPSLAEGQQVLYAGEVFFNNGRLEWWSNGSGHYQPDEDNAEQANLPMDYFYSYQQIIKGEHARKNRPDTPLRG